MTMCSSTTRLLVPVRWPYQQLYRGHVVDAMPEPLPQGLYRAKVLITETDADGRTGYGCVFFPAGGTFASQGEAAAYGMSLGRERVDDRVVEVEPDERSDRSNTETLRAGYPYPAHQS